LTVPLFYSEATGEPMKRKADIFGEKSSRPRKVREIPPARQLVRDSTWEAEKKWFEDHKSLDALSVFAKYFQRLG
jgi:hypothetical protein